MRNFLLGAIVALLYGVGGVIFIFLIVQIAKLIIEHLNALPSVDDANLYGEEEREQ